MMRCYMYNNLMLPLSYVGRGLAFLVLLSGFPVWIFAQQTVSPVGGEQSIVGTLPGDQVWPAASAGPAGAYLLWQGNANEGTPLPKAKSSKVKGPTAPGWGIGAERLDRSFNATTGTPFRVNQRLTGDQEKPRVAVLKNGGAAVAWQGPGKLLTDIYAAFVGPDGNLVKSDVAVNTYTKDLQINPDVAALADGNAVVTWQSFQEEGAGKAYFGVYAQRFTPAGAKLGREFHVNQTTNYNQRTPTVAGLANGTFVVVWVSEQQRFQNSVDLYGRIFDANGSPLGNEFPVSANTNVCANPAVTATGDGFTVAWGQKDLSDRFKSWDIIACSFNSSGAPLGPELAVNSFTYGDQFAPRISAIGTTAFVVWTSLGQDGSWEGVYGRAINTAGEFVSDEFRVNTTTASKQMHPVVASDGQSQFWVIWTSYIGGAGRFDLFGQQYALGGAANAR